jgi:hypothetical protein
MYVFSSQSVCKSANLTKNWLVPPLLKSTRPAFYASSSWCQEDVLRRPSTTPGKAAIRPADGVTDVSGDLLF